MRERFLKVEKPSMTVTEVDRVTFFMLYNLSNTTYIYNNVTETMENFVYVNSNMDERWIPSRIP